MRALDGFHGATVLFYSRLTGKLVGGTDKAKRMNSIRPTMRLYRIDEMIGTGRDDL